MAAPIIKEIKVTDEQQEYQDTPIQTCPKFSDNALAASKKKARYTTDKQDDSHKIGLRARITFINR